MEGAAGLPLLLVPLGLVAYRRRHAGRNRFRRVPMNDDYHAEMASWDDTPRYRFIPLPAGRIVTREKDGKSTTEFKPKTQEM